MVALVGAFAAMTGSGGRRNEKGKGERTRGIERAGAKMNLIYEQNNIGFFKITNVNLK